jgi:hypothetical protein
MNTRFLVAALALVVAASLAEAKIIDATCTAGDGGGIVMEGMTWEWSDAEMTARMWVREVQKLPVGYLYPTFTADSELDPSAHIIKEVDNDTTFAWTDYHINLTLNKTFQIVSAVQPTGWLTPVMTQPSEVSPGVWQGAVDYYYGGPGTEILIGGTATYDVKASFAGSANFTVEQRPTPEPSTLGLLAIGAVALLRRR